MTVKTSDEVRAFLRSLAPEPRRKVLAALDRVEAGAAKIEALEEPLENFYKIKAGQYRVICVVDGNTLFALFADFRSTVYEVASAGLLESILERVRRN